MTCIDENFDVKQCSVYTENAPTPTAQEDQKQIAAVDAVVSEKAKDALVAQWTADTMSLARDCAQLGHLMKEVLKSEGALRTERVLHLKSQNVIGASVIQEFMAMNMAVHSGPQKDQLNLMDRVGLTNAVQVQSCE